MLFSVIVTLAIGLIAWVGSSIGLQYFFGWALPIFAVGVFLVGMTWRILYWASSPVPFAIPTVGGQERSLKWVTPARLDAPTSTVGVIGRLLLEMCCFRSLFRNMDTYVDAKNQRITYFSTKWLWLCGLMFHYSLFIIVLRHFRFVMEPVPAWLNWLEFADGILQIGVPTLMLTDVLILVALGFLLMRRLVNQKVRYLSMVNDYFPLCLLIAIVLTGIGMRYCYKADVTQAKVFIMGIFRLSPQATTALNPLFFVHVTLVSTLLIMFPFSKLVHMGGMFFSPTRNLKCNTRAEYHENPWNTPTEFHTYAEYEDEFRDVMVKAGIPVEITPEEAEKNKLSQTDAGTSAQ